MTYAVPKFKIGDTVLYSGGNTQIAHDPIKIAARYNSGDAGWKYKVPKVTGDFTWVFEGNLRLPDARPAPPAPATYGPMPAPSQPAPEEILEGKVLAMWDAEAAAAEARKAVAAEMKAQAEAEERKALEDAELARVAALRERIGYELLLAAATSLLLRAIARDTEGYEPELKGELAKFRHELQPLAETYGYAIVPVGDGSRATISMI